MVKISDLTISLNLTPLKEFTLYYFLGKFNCRTLAIQLLQDFILTLKTQHRKNRRFGIFLDLMGMSSLKESDLETASRLEKSIVRLKGSIKSLPICTAFYLKVLYHIKISKKTKSDFLLPNHDSN